MPFQIVLVMETDEKSRTDYIYIRSILEKYYNLSQLRDVKISPVFMGGKGNYNKKKVINAINSYKRQYKKIGESYVIYCFDTDKYESNPLDQKLLIEEERYCKDNGYEFVWFCHDVEEVFLGRSVAASEKVAEAKKYITNKMVEKVSMANLKAEKMSKQKSNVVLVLEEIFDMKNKE